MPEPDEIQFACIGCGAMNPVAAKVCAGCGHEFAGPTFQPSPAVSPIQQTPTQSRPTPIREFDEPGQDSDDRWMPDRNPTLGSHVLRILASLLIVVLGTAAFFIVIGIAGAIAFFTLCGANSQAGLAGFGLLVMLGVVVGAMNALFRFLRDATNPRRRNHR